jgi:hypothetical protein
MTCKNKSADTEIVVSTEVVCKSHQISPRSSAPHHVELTNLLPVSADVQLRAECVGGRPLSYSGRKWRQTVSLPPVPRWRRPGPVKLSEDITHDGTPSPQGKRQDILVLVTTLPSSARSQTQLFDETYAQLSISVRC